jgi:hypothetical protein
MTRNKLIEQIIKIPILGKILNECLIAKQNLSINQ